MRSCGAGGSFAPFSAARRRLVQGVDDQGRFAAARDAGDAGEEPERNRRRDVFQVVAARADDRELTAGIAGAAPGRDRDRPLAREIVAGQRIGIGGDFGRRSLGDDLAPVHAGARADVDDVIGGPDRILVVLDDDHRIAQAPQAPERIEEARVVALVEADRRLVEHIEHAGEARADLRSEPDALALAARQRAGRTREREIIEPDVAQEREPVDDLLQDSLRDLVALGVELRRQALGPFDRRADREQAHLADVLAVDLDRQRLRLEAKAVAGFAGRRGHVALDLLARPLAFGLVVAALEIGDHALERLLHFIGAQAIVIGEADLIRRPSRAGSRAALQPAIRSRACRAGTYSVARAPRASAGNRANSSSPRARSLPGAS